MPYLREHPPVHILVAALAGVKPPRGRRPEPDLAELRARLGTGDIYAGFGGAAILDFAALKRAQH